MFTFGNKNPFTILMRAKTETQAQKVLKHLKKGRSLTSLSALRLFSVISFPKRICEILAMGYEVEKKRIAVINKFGERVYVNKYKLKTLNQL